MILWLDAQISPRLRPKIRREFKIEVVHVRDLGLREAEDPKIFDEARRAKAVVLTKDEDFVILVERLGPPPQIIWLTCGHVSNARLKKSSLLGFGPRRGDRVFPGSLSPRFAGTGF